MSERLGHFLIFIVLTIITIGLYPVFSFVTRQQEIIFDFSVQEVTQRYLDVLRPLS